MHSHLLLLLLGVFKKWVLWLKYDSLIHNADIINKLFLLFNSLVYNLKM